MSPSARFGQGSKAASRGRERLWTAAFLTALWLAIGLVYAQTLGHDFVFDDEYYVVLNRHLHAGFNRESLDFALTGVEQANWHPLTWLSHLTDIELFGLAPRGHHAVNVLLHAAAATALFFALRSLTQAPLVSGFVALGFALHPAHVESVAWISERKDVLSALLGFLALWAYAAYAWRAAAGQGRQGAFYVAAGVALALGLMAKQMLVTWPFVFLLFDIWPLRRLALAGRRVAGGQAQRVRVLAEKVPFVALAGTAAGLAVMAQGRGGAIASLDVVPFATRVQNALVSIAGYLRLLVWPRGLSAFYPYPARIAPVTVLGAVLLIAFLSFVAWRSFGRRPYLAIGWCFFLGTLVPVIGLVQIGQQSMADRYTYIPAVGIFLAVGCLLAELAARSLRARRAVLAGAGIVLASWGILAHAQAATWRNSITLWQHALQVTRANHLAHNNLGMAYIAAGNLDRGYEEFKAAVAIRPSYAEALSNLGNAARDRGQPAEAIGYQRQAIALEPQNGIHEFNLATAEFAAGNLAAADSALGRALAKGPPDPRVEVRLGQLRVAQGRMPEAHQAFAAALTLDPRHAEALFSEGNLLAAEGRCADAIPIYERLLASTPDHAPGLANLGECLAREDRLADAEGRLVRALELDPNHLAAQRNLAKVLLAEGKMNAAGREYAAVLARTPTDPEALFGRGHTFAVLGQPDSALGYYRRAVLAAPRWPAALAGLAWFRATTAVDSLRNPPEALALARGACELTGGRDARALDALGAALAALGQFQAAQSAAQAAAAAAQVGGRAQYAAAIAEREQLYARHQPVLETALKLPD